MDLDRLLSESPELLVPWVHRATCITLMTDVFGGDPPLEPLDLGGVLAAVPALATRAGPDFRPFVEMSPDERDDIWVRVIERLRASGGRFEELEPGVYASRAADGLDVARVLLTDRILALRVRGKPVVVAPNDSLLLVCGDADAAAIERVASIARDAFTGPEHRSLRALRLGDDGWEEHTPEAFATNRALTLELEYHELLTTLHSGYEAPPPCAFRAGTHALEMAWSRNDEVLLPGSGWITLYDPSDESTPTTRVRLSTFLDTAARRDRGLAPAGVSRSVRHVPEPCAPRVHARARPRAGSASAPYVAGGALRRARRPEPRHALRPRWLR